jgi:hypothetical protein
MPNEPLVPEHTQVSLDNRVSLPKRFSDSVAWIKGTEVPAWLFLLELGRYRLLSDEDVKDDPVLESVRLLILHEEQTVTIKASEAESSADAAIMARLIPITIKSHKGSWRMPFPEELASLAPLDCNPRSISILASPKGFVEIWYTDMLRRVLTPPWKNRK